MVCNLWFPLWLLASDLFPREFSSRVFAFWAVNFCVFRVFCGPFSLKKPYPSLFKVHSIAVEKHFSFVERLISSVEILFSTVEAMFSFVEIDFLSVEVHIIFVEINIIYVGSHILFVETLILYVEMDILCVEIGFKNEKIRVFLLTSIHTGDITLSRMKNEKFFVFRRSETIYGDEKNGLKPETAKNGENEQIEIPHHIPMDTYIPGSGNSLSLGAGG
jgi:hypothetical protein